MIAKVFAIAALATVAFAGPIGGGGINNSCNAGAVQCCNQLQSAKSTQVDFITALLGVAIGDLTGQVGTSCSPISAIAIAGNSCSTQPVCCSENNFNGLINAGCTPINANL